MNKLLPVFIAVFLTLCILKDIYNIYILHSGRTQALQYFQYETDLSKKEYADIDQRLFNYRQFMAPTRLAASMLYEEIESKPQSILDSLIAMDFDEDYTSICLRFNDYYFWLRDNLPCMKTPMVRDFFITRLRAMQYEMVEEDFRRSPCYFYLPKFEFAKSIAEDSIYFGAYAGPGDHRKYLVEINNQWFRECCDQMYSVPADDTLQVTVYEVSLGWPSSLDTLSDSQTLVWKDDRWDKLK